jgi:hypothetical protein
MKKLFVTAAVCIGMLVAAARAQADYVCRLDALNNDYLSVRIQPAGSAIEVARLSPNTFVTVEGSPQEGWVKVSVPGRPPGGWVFARNICPGQPQ